MASNPPARCCTIGVKHEGAPKGKIEQLGSISTYFAYPESKQTDNAIIILTDVIGHQFVNAQLIADQFAENGYFVVMPDLFNGDPIPLNRPEGFELPKWLNGPPGHLPNTVDPIVTESIKELRGKYGAKKIGAVGYCFGAKYVIRFLGQVGKDNGATVDVGYAAHPSFVDADELKVIDGPLSISAAETDEIFPEAKRHESEGILKELAKGPKSIAYQLNLFSHVSHGFAVRADLSVPAQKFAKEQAFIQAVQWFDYYLKGPSK